MESWPINVIPDTSFFVYFLDDVNITDMLDKLIQNDTYVFVLCRLVERELRNGNHNDFLNKYYKHLKIFSYYNIGEILKPFFSKDELEKGEHEVIVAAYVYHYFENKNYIAILDDLDARKFVEKNFPEIFQNITGTLGFIVKSYCTYGVISFDDAQRAINACHGSKFYIKEEILKNLKNELIRCTES